RRVPGLRRSDQPAEDEQACAGGRPECFGKPLRPDEDERNRSERNQPDCNRLPREIGRGRHSVKNKTCSTSVFSGISTFPSQLLCGGPGCVRRRRTLTAASHENEKQ